jgi:hypothetical protein
MVLSFLQTTRSAQTTHRALPDGVRAMATVRVHADGLDPKDVTALLGLEPELAALKGGRLRRLPDGGSVIAPTGTWFITSEGRVMGGPVEHLAWAVDLVSDRIGKLRNLSADVDVDLSLMISGAEEVVIKTFRAEAEALVPLIRAGTQCGAVDIDLPTAGAELSFAQGEPVDLGTIAARLRE